VLALFLNCRYTKTTDAREEVNEALRDLCEDTQDTIQNYRLIADYFQRPKAVKSCKEKVAHFNKTSVNSSAINVNNTFAAKWLATALVGVWTLYGGNQVLRGKLSIGAFVTTTSVFKALGNEYIGIYSCYLRVQTAFPALQHVVLFLNLPTDVVLRMQVNRARRNRGIKEQAQANAQVERGQHLMGREQLGLVPVAPIGSGAAFSVREPC